jgi:hypothetical protein
MIISFSGKIKSGKDECAKIVQYLTSYLYQEQHKTYEEFLKSSFYNQRNNESGPEWEIKKWAGAVKQVCSILLNIPVEDFEKESVKDRVLGKEWNQPAYYRAEYNAPEPSFLPEYIKFPTADAILQEIVPAWAGIKAWEYHLEKLQNLKETHDTCYAEIGQYNVTYYPEEPITIRWMLQNVGTNAMRHVIHQNVWINCLMAYYLSDEDGDYPTWIITDTRFPNEANAVVSNKGINIRIARCLPVVHEKSTVCRRLLCSSRTPSSWRYVPSSSAVLSVRMRNRRHK